MSTNKKHTVDYTDFPTTGQLKKELDLENYKRSYARIFRSTVFTLITVAAAAVLVAVLFMPVLQIYGTSMTPTLDEGDIVVSVKGTKVERGELLAFYLGNKILGDGIKDIPDYQYRIVNQGKENSRTVVAVQ